MRTIKILLYLFTLTTLSGCGSCGAVSPEDLVAQREQQKKNVPRSPYVQQNTESTTNDALTYHDVTVNGNEVTEVNQNEQKPEVKTTATGDVKMTSVSGANFIVNLTEQIALPKSVSFTHYSKQKTVIKGSTNFAFNEESITIFYGNAVGIESNVVLKFVSDFNREFTCEATIIRATVTDDKTKYALAIYFDRQKSKIIKIQIGQTTYYKEGG